MTARPTLRPASDFDLAFLARLFNRCFDGYFVPVHETPEGLAARLRHDSIDLSLSRVAFLDDRAAGILYASVRGWGCRIAGMGVVPEARRRGVGRRLMTAAMAGTRAVGLRYLVLEVVEQNSPALELYRGLGFQPLRRLVGYELEGPAGAPAAEAVRDAEALEPIDPRQVARLVSQEAEPDLPWQLAAETLAAYGPPIEGLHLAGKAFALLQDTGEALTAHTLLTRREHRRKGWASRLVRALREARRPRPWRIPARVPEDLAAGFLDSLGFRRMPLTQLEMRLEPNPGSALRGGTG